MEVASTPSVISENQQSDRFNAFANGFSNTGQGIIAFSFSSGSPTALNR
jgi:hypothetical protein